MSLSIISLTSHVWAHPLVTFYDLSLRQIHFQDFNTALERKLLIKFQSMNSIYLYSQLYCLHLKFNMFKINNVVLINYLPHPSKVVVPHLHFERRPRSAKTTLYRAEKDPEELNDSPRG